MSGPQTSGPARQLSHAITRVSSFLWAHSAPCCSPNMTVPTHTGAPCVGSSGPSSRGVRPAAPPGRQMGGGVAQSKLQKLLCLLPVPVHPQGPSAPWNPQWHPPYDLPIRQTARGPQEVDAMAREPLLSGMEALGTRKPETSSLKGNANLAPADAPKPPGWGQPGLREPSEQPGICS